MARRPGAAPAPSPATLGPAGALRAALSDLYQHSLLLLALNAAFGGAAAAVLVAASYVQAAFALMVPLGALAAVCAHCAAVLVTTGDLAPRDAAVGLRRHGKRGLALGAATVVWGGTAAFAFGFYAQRGPAFWPLAALVAYLAAFGALVQIALWPLAVSRPGAPLRRLPLEAAIAVLKRPRAFLALGGALLLVNLAGTLTVLPLFTVTIMFSFVAAAHLVLGRGPGSEV